MKPIDYFKLQAKNLYRDYKTQYAYQVDADGTKHFTYKPKYFDMDEIFLDFEDFDEEDFSLMKAQHLLATRAMVLHVYFLLVQQKVSNLLLLVLQLSFMLLTCCIY